MKKHWILFFILPVLLLADPALETSVEIISKGSEWQYQLDPEAAPNELSKNSYDASEWDLGLAGFGYGDEDDATTLKMRGVDTRLAIRHSFELKDSQNPKKLWLAIRYDDAIEVWLNGDHLFDRGIERKNGKVDDVDSHEADEKWEYISIGAHADLLHPDGNCLAIIGHNVKLHSSDFTLDPFLILGDREAPEASQMASGRALADKFRVVWSRDPTTMATVAWNQIEGAPGVLYYDTKDHGLEFADYRHQIKVGRTVDQDPMSTCFARMTGLQPDCEYFFVIKDQAGVSPRMKFRTAPREARPFTFIAGGDSRNGRKVRVLGNKTAAKLRPLFIAFTGDFVASDSNKRWVDWLDDWQHTISEDGTMIPLVPHRGNHERNPRSIHDTFDTPKNAYYAFSIGSEMFRYYALNSQIPAGDHQGKWLDQDLSKNRAKVTHLVAGYHHPMRPHVRGKREGENPKKWAEAFYKHGLDLAIESDSHVMKRTLPLRPDEDGDEGFSHSKNDKNATIYIGEGCWGAPLRKADDGKDWTIAQGSFNGFDWLHVTPEKIEIKTVHIGSVDTVEAVQSKKPFETPSGLRLWQPAAGEILEVRGDKQ